MKNEEWNDPIIRMINQHHREKVLEDERKQEALKQQMRYNTNTKGKIKSHKRTEDLEYKLKKGMLKATLITGVGIAILASSFSKLSKEVEMDMAREQGLEVVDTMNYSYGRQVFINGEKKYTKGQVIQRTFELIESQIDNVFSRGK